jgi:hypothetical protein
MKRDVLNDKTNSSFLSCEKDIELILKKLFVDNRPYSDYLKKLLVINTKDCISEFSNNKKDYQTIISDYNVSTLFEEGYVTIVPKIKLVDHSKVKSYIIVSFDNFSPTSNPQYRDCTITFDVICHTDYWDIGNFQLRPLKIIGYIDGILNNAKLTGIGELQFLSCKELVLDENLSGYSLMYMATHGNDDKIEEGDIVVN